MISADLMLTNWHCGGEIGMPIAAYWNSDVCANAIVDLGWDDGAISRQYNCIEVVAKDRRLDYALMRLRPVVGSGGTTGEPVKARISTIPPAAGHNVFIVHHAQCKPKLLSDQCAITGARYRAWTDPPAAVSEREDAVSIRPDFTHDCDTEPGASGAPVFNSAGQVVGLHHTGFERDSQCKAIDRLNKAVRMDEIIGHLRTKTPIVLRELKID